jgi:hypothetical protein
LTVNFLFIHRLYKTNNAIIFANCGKREGDLLSIRPFGKKIRHARRLRWHGGTNKCEYSPVEVAEKHSF